MDEKPDELPDLIRIHGAAAPAWRRVLLLVGGIVCVVLGLVGWLVPVVTGIPFWVAGAVMLGGASPTLGRWINARERRLPRRVRRLLRPSTWRRSKPRA